MTAWIFLLSACSVNHGVRPLGKGKVAVDASAGGPVVRAFDAPVPLPLSTVGVRYGVSDRSDVHAAFHPSLAGMFGVWGVDAGASYLIFEQQGLRPALLVDGTATAVWGDTNPEGPEGGFRLFTNVAALGSWTYGERGNLVYGGADVFVQPYPWGVLGGPLVGHQLRLGERVGLVTELKWMGGSHPTEDLTAHWYGPGRNGVLVPQIGLNVALGGGQ